METDTSDQENTTDKFYEDITFPSLVERMKAVFFDIFILLVVFTLTSLFIDSISDIPAFGKGVIFIFMIYLYDPILIAFTGGTLGHKSMKLKVRRYKHPDKKITLWQAFIRFIIKGLLGWLSFLTVTSNKHRRAIHDLTSGSIILHDK